MSPGNRAGQVGGTNFVLCSDMGNLIPVTEMKNAQQARKIPVEPRSDLSATIQAMRGLKCFVTGSPGIRAKVII